MPKNVGTQTNDTPFKLLNHDYSLCQTDYSKNIIILESKIQEYSAQIQELKKEFFSLNTIVEDKKQIVFI